MPNEYLITGEKKTVISVRYGVVERAVRQHFGKPYNLITSNTTSSGMPAVNGTYLIISADPEDERLDHILEYTSEEKLWRGEDGPGLGTLLNQMAYDGVIEPGNYLIHVWW